MAVARAGEKFVCQKLIQQDWVVMARNYRKRGVEIDIIAQKESTIIAVEVKTRKRIDTLEFLFKPRQLARIEGELLRFIGQRRLSYYSLRIDGALVMFQLPWQVVDLRYFVNIADDLRRARGYG